MSACIVLLVIIIAIILFVFIIGLYYYKSSAWVINKIDKNGNEVDFNFSFTRLVLIEGFIGILLFMCTLGCIKCICIID